MGGVSLFSSLLDADTGTGRPLTPSMLCCEVHIALMRSADKVTAVCKWLMVFIVLLGFVWCAGGNRGYNFGKDVAMVALLQACALIFYFSTMVLFVSGLAIAASSDHTQWL